MNSLQQIVDRLESLLYKEKATPEVLHQLEREFEEANMVGTLRTHSTMAFCMDLMDTLRELTPWAIGEPTKPLFQYETAQDLVDAMIPGNGHLD